MSDLQLRQYVLDEIQFEPSVNVAHIGVAAEAGVVTLTGHVGTYAEKLGRRHGDQARQGCSWNRRRY